MKLLFVADGRSPIALNWMGAFANRGHEIHLVSTFACEPSLPLKSLRFCPVAFSQFGQTGRVDRTGLAAGSFAGVSKIRLRMRLRHWLGPWTIHFSARRLREWIAALEPDLVHAMRIPFEGMLAANADPSYPLLISVWGNDFTLHAPATPWMKQFTRRTLQRATALHVDCYRDRRLAHDWGFPEELPILVLPGAGGVRRELFYRGEASKKTEGQSYDSLFQGLDREVPVVANPRGFRASVRNDTFFKAIPLILEKRPETIFLCPAMAQEAEAEAWIDRLGIKSTSVRLLPKLSPEQMGMVFRRGQVMVSITEHDGTPNTLLEAMACGSFPVVGDLESVREWIEDGINGFLVNPDDPEEAARAVLQALSSERLRARAAVHNQEVIDKRAEQGKVIEEAEAFYRRLID